MEQVALYNTVTLNEENNHMYLQHVFGILSYSKNNYNNISP
jgi:hypothetical protein